MATHAQRMAVARELADWLRTRFGGVVSDVRLFGSVARGSDEEYSDIDLLILVTRPLTAAERDQLAARAYDLDLAQGTVTQCIVRLDKVMDAAGGSKWRTGARGRAGRGAGVSEPQRTRPEALAWPTKPSQTPAGCLNRAVCEGH